MSRSNFRSGLALIVVIAILGVLVILGTAFVTLARLERRASQQRIHATRALLLARSGLEDALARIGAGQDPDAAGNRYGGEDWDNSGALNGLEVSAEMYLRGVRNTDDCPVRHALRPSFFVKDTSSLGADLQPAPRRIVLEGRERGCSGSLSGIDSDPYALKVTTEGGLYLNGGDPSVPVDLAAPDYNLNLRRMLGILAEALDREDGANNGVPVDQADGENLISLRPGAGWEGWGQVRDVALGGSQDKLAALRPYLTLHAFVDKKVIRPNAVAGMEGTSPQSWADIKLAHETYPGLPGTKEPDFERIPVLPGGKLVGRSPVDLAWARTRRPVLIALLAGLKGLYLDESTATPISYGDRIGTLRSAEIPLSWAGIGDDCRRTADWILTSSSELRTWEQWNGFCDALPGALFTGTPGEIQAKRDLLKANFNPNADLNKFNPNASLWRGVDKSDLLAYSTEFSLLPQAHAQELECAGRLLGPDGRLLSSRVLRASLAPAGRLTLSTQKEFVCEELGDLSVAGDEQAFRKPGQPGTPFISLSAGTGKTWGHALGLGWVGLGTVGAGLQTFPEPCVQAALGAPLSIRPADYDGSIQLATVETRSDEFYTVRTPPKDMKLLARYTADLDLGVSGAAPLKLPGDERWKNQPDVQQVTYNGAGPANLSELGSGLWDPVRPNTLYPDGVYSEKDRAPSYLDRDNANGIQGLVSFWIKSNHDGPGRGGHPFFKWTNFREIVSGFVNWAASSRNQFFWLGDSYGSVAGTHGMFSVDGVTSMFEVTHSTVDDLKEHLFRRGSHLTPHQWSLITMSYDFRSPDKDDCGELLVNTGLTAVDQGSVDSYPDSLGCDPSSASDITLADLFGAHRIVLGKGKPEAESFLLTYSTGSGADATFDELAIYDFGGAGLDGIPPASLGTKASPGVLAAKRFKDGRYYKESVYPASGGLLTAQGPLRNAGEYFSPPISLGPCRIKALAWTQIVPQELGAGRILLELADASGNDYLNDASGKPVRNGFLDPVSSRVDRRVDTLFRLHAVFLPNLDPAALQDTPILDPLALDDVTVMHEPVTGRRIMAWGGTAE